MKNIITILLFFSTYLFSCAGYYFYPYYYKDMQISFITEYEKNPLFQSFAVYEMSYDGVHTYYAKIKRELNLKEWGSYLRVSKEEAKEIIYDSKSDNKELKEYLALTNKVNALLNRFFYDEKEVQKYVYFIQETKNIYESQKDDFLKLRYAYQYIRVLHKFNKYDEEIEFIDSIRGLQKSSIVWEWIDSYYAGAFKRLKNYAKSSYLDALIFMHHKSDPYIGFYDFKITSDSEWSELIKRARDDEERIVFHYLRAKNSDGADIFELEAMSEINPNSIWVKRLKKLIAFKVEEEHSDNEYSKRFLNYLQKYQNYDNNHYLLSYLTLRINKKLIDSNNKMLVFMNYVLNLKSLDENKLSKELEATLESMKNEKLKLSLKRWTIQQIEKFYSCENPKSLLASGYYSPKDSLVEYDLNRLINLKTFTLYQKLKNKKDKNLIEKLLLSASKEPYSNTRKTQILAIGYTANGEFDKALKELSKLSKKDRRVSSYNPFNTNIYLNNRAYKDGKEIVTSKHPYSHEKFLKTIKKLDLSKAQDNFLLANAWYNISIFGNSPIFSTIFRSILVVPCYLKDEAKHQLDMAKNYYQKALELSNDKEFKAKVEFQLLKVAHSYKLLNNKDTDFIPEFGLDYDNKNQMKEFMQNNKLFIKQLERFKKYKDTNFYKQAIKNCATFSYFK